MQNKKQKLDKTWTALKQDYKLTEIMGNGSFGQVVKATHRETKNVFAIKRICFDPSKETHLRKIIREITLLRKLSEQKLNVYTTRLYDVLYQPASQNDGETLDVIFLVLEYCDYDIAKAILNECPVNLEEDHVLTVIYNILCAVNFIHSAGVIHRDLKPSNILINSEC